MHPNFEPYEEIIAQYHPVTFISEDEPPTMVERIIEQRDAGALTSCGIKVVVNPVANLYICDWI